MIAPPYVTEWRHQAPWIQDLQVEQDLILSRALVEIFQEPIVAEVFCGSDFWPRQPVDKLRRPSLRWHRALSL